MNTILNASLLKLHHTWKPSTPPKQATKWQWCTPSWYLQTKTGRAPGFFWPRSESFQKCFWTLELLTIGGRNSWNTPHSYTTRVFSRQACSLVGGWTNPSEKYSSNRIISPGRDENKKYLKPSPSNFIGLPKSLATPFTQLIGKLLRLPNQQESGVLFAAWTKMRRKKQSTTVYNLR